LTSLSIAFNST